MLMFLCHFKLYFLLVAFDFGLLMAFDNILEPDQAQRNFGPDLNDNIQLLTSMRWI